MPFIQKIFQSNQNFVLREKIHFLYKYLEDDFSDEVWKEKFSCFSKILKYKPFKIDSTQEFLVFITRKDKRISNSLKIQFESKIFKIEKIIDFITKKNFLVIITSRKT
ncbi:MAG: hypothetical protein ISN64_02640 [Rickettsia sp.]|nr:hypothetical protein [Rickettsia sp.]